MRRTALDRAERLFSSGRFNDVISLLEPSIPIYRESQRFYYLLGSSCLRSGDAGGAATYLKRAEQLSPSNPETMLALAALAVRKGETEKAVDFYLRVLEDRPGDRRARECLAVLRKEGGPEGITRLLETGKIERLYPGRRQIPRFILPVAIVVAAVTAIYLTLPFGLSFVESLSRPRVVRPEVAAVTLSRSEKESPVETGGSFRFVLTERQALDAFERAKDYFQAYRDNAAVIEINRLLGSNASAALKEKATSLRAFIGRPDFRTIRDAPSFAEAMRDPGSFNACTVAWKGMAANVRSEAGVVSFDFLVGYQDKKRLEGLVPARISGAEVPMDRPLEILATIRSANGLLTLDCAAIHELAQGKAP